LPDITFTHGNIFEIPWWEEANVIYVASLLFSESMMVELTKLALKIKLGSWFVSLQPLRLEEIALKEQQDENGDDYFSSSSSSNSSATVRKNKLILCSESFYKMSWNMAKVYIYQMREA